VIAASVAAIAAIAGFVARDWGECGYHFTQFEDPVGYGSVLAEVTASDDGRFWVGSTCHACCVHADTRSAAEAALRAAIAAERPALSGL
jgi:hypothetical protein